MEGFLEFLKLVVLIIGIVEYNMVFLNSILKVYFWEMGLLFLFCRIRSGVFVVKVYFFRMWLKDFLVCFDFELKNVFLFFELNSM